MRVTSIGANSALCERPHLPLRRRRLAQELTGIRMRRRIPARREIRVIVLARLDQARIHAAAASGQLGVRTVASYKIPAPQLFERLGQPTLVDAALARRGDQIAV